MFCEECGNKLASDALFCTKCGHANGNNNPQEQENKENSEEKFEHEEQYEDEYEEDYEDDYEDDYEEDNRSYKQDRNHISARGKVPHNKNEYSQNQYQSSTKNKKQCNSLIMVPIALIFFIIIGFAGYIGFSILQVKPTFSGEMVNEGMANYLENSENYSVSDDDTVTLFLSNKYISNIIFNDIQDSSSDIVINSLEYDPEKEVAKINASKSFINFQANFKSEIDFKSKDNDLMLNYNFYNTTFGKNNNELGILSSFINVEDYSGNITLPNLNGITKLQDVNFDSDGVTLKLVFTEEKILAKIDEFTYEDIDENYLDYVYPEGVYLVGALTEIKSKEDLKNILFCLNTEGIQKAFDKAPIIKNMIEKNFIDTAETEKNKILEEYVVVNKYTNEEYAEQIISAAYSSGKFDICTFRNGKIFSGSNSSKQIKFEDIEDRSLIPEGVEMKQMTLLYDAIEKKVAVSFFKDDGDMILFYPDSTSKSYTNSDYIDLFIMNEEINESNTTENSEDETEYTNNEGRVSTSNSTIMSPTSNVDPQRKAILRGMKTFENAGEDDTYFTRYIRYDDNYAYLVASNVNSYQDFLGYFLSKQSDGTWKVEEKVKRENYIKSIITNPNYNGINANIFPVIAPDSADASGTLSSSELNDLPNRYSSVPWPKDSNGAYYKPLFYSSLNDYAIIIIASPTYDRFLINPNGSFTAFSSYSELMDIIKYTDCPEYITIQSDKPVS